MAKRKSDAITGGNVTDGSNKKSRPNRRGARDNQLEDAEAVNYN